MTPFHTRLHVCDPMFWAEISWVGIISLWYEFEPRDAHQKIKDFHFYLGEKWIENELVQALELVLNYQRSIKVPPRLVCQMLFLKNIGSTSPHFGIMYFILILNYESFKCLLFFFFFFSWFFPSWHFLFYNHIFSLQLKVEVSKFSEGIMKDLGVFVFESMEV
jgi:hypothetical protein